MSNFTATEIPKSALPPLSQDDGIYKFMRGKECDFKLLRSKLMLNNSSPDSNDESYGESSNEVANEAMNQNNVYTLKPQQEQEENILTHMKNVSVTIQNVPDVFENIQGYLIMTTKRVFFMEATDDRESNNDFSIDARCISLHAMMSEPESSVYCQLAEGSVSCSNDSDENGDDSMGPAEIFFHPLLDGNVGNSSEQEILRQKTELCQSLFDSFSKLINMNPVEDDEDDDNAFGGLGAMLGMLAGQEGESDQDEMICRIDPSQIGTGWDEKMEDTDTEGGATNSEREAMLQRLDNMLVVPPEYKVDGQFDDADEMDEDDKNLL